MRSALAHLRSQYVVGPLIAFVVLPVLLYIGGSALVEALSRTYPSCPGGGLYAALAVPQPPMPYWVIRIEQAAFALVAVAWAVSAVILPVLWLSSGMNEARAARSDALVRFCTGAVCIAVLAAVTSGSLPCLAG